MKILITGGLHTGKSTALKKVLKGINSENMIGLFTSPVFEGDEKAGHKIKLTNDDSYLFAHKNIISEILFGQFGVDLSAFNKAVDSIEKAIKEADWLVIDELGIIESVDDGVSNKVVSIIQESKKALIVIQSRAVEFWLSRLSIESYDVLFSLTEANREKIPGWISNLITEN